MKNSTLILLGLVGFGIYWYMKKQKETSDATVLSPTQPIAPDLSNDKFFNTVPSETNIKYTISGFRKIGKIPNTI